LASVSDKATDAFSMREEIQRRISLCIEHRASFGFESNLVYNYNYDIVNELSAKNYRTVLYFIGADNVNTLNERIRQRVVLGFHYVAPADVSDRYKSTLQKLPANLKLFDKAILFDNSIQDVFPKEILHLEKGMITWKSDHPPIWLNEILPTIQKLSDAYQKLAKGK
jgi:predicted ABC-type ATPase